MAEQNVVIKMLADVSGADANFKRLRKTLSDLSGGTLTLGKNMRIFEQGTRGSISAQAAAEKVAKSYNQSLQAQLQIARGNASAMQAVTAMHNAEAKAIQAKVALINAELALDNTALRQMQQDLQLRKLSIQEIELENRALRANAVAKSQSASGSRDMSAAASVANDRIQASQNITGGATFALTSLGQAFSDAGQFGMGFAQGIRAITNNVQQVATGIFFLNQQTGSMAASMAALKGALTGPLGILFAIQVVTAGFEFLTGIMQKSKREAKETTNAFSDLVKIFDSVTDGGGFSITFDDAAVAAKRLADQIDINQRKIESLEVAASRPTQSMAQVSALIEQQKALGALDDEIAAAVEPFKEQIEALENERRLRKLLNEQLTEEERIRGAVAAVADRQNGIMRDAAEAILDRIDDVKNELPEIDLELPEALRLFGQEVLDKIKESVIEVGNLREGLSLLQGPEGARLAVLELQKDELEEQVKNVKALNRLRASGAPLGMGAVGLQGTEALTRSRLEEIKRRQEKEGAMGPSGPDRLFLPSSISAVLAEQEKFEEQVKRQEDLNQRMAESFGKLGSDLLTAFATIGGGFDAFTATMGRFMQNLGRQMIQVGLTTEAFGGAMIAFKAALKANPILAIAAGAALVAIGSRLAKQASNAANNPGQNAGLGFIQAPGIVGGAFDFGGTRAIGAGVLGTQARPSGINVSGQFVIEGRDLVAVVATETSRQVQSGRRNPLLTQ